MNRLHKFPGIVVEELGEELLLYRPTTHKAIHLNGTAAAIFKLCDGTRSLADLVALLEGMFPDAKPRIAGEVRDVVDQLLRDGALTEQPS
ncbi:MAG: PqqD family protein [Methyloceanibacter sp.]